MTQACGPILSVLLLVGCLAPATVPAQTPPGADRACRSLAALYARAAEQFTPQDLAALQTCLSPPTADPAPAPGQPAGPQPVNRFPEQWPAPAPWTTTADPWSYPTVW